MDAAWTNQAAISYSTGIHRTGVGVHIQIEEAGVKASAQVSAVGNEASSPLQAEAMALQFATEVVPHIQNRAITFFADNTLLAQAAASRNPILCLGHSEIRTQLAGLIEATSSVQTQVFHTPRENNKEAQLAGFIEMFKIFIEKCWPFIQKS